MQIVCLSSRFSLDFFQTFFLLFLFTNMCANLKQRLHSTFCRTSDRPSQRPHAARTFKNRISKVNFVSFYLAFINRRHVQLYINIAMWSNPQIQKSLLVLWVVFCCNENAFALQTNGRNKPKDYQNDYNSLIIRTENKSALLLLLQEDDFYAKMAVCHIFALVWKNFLFSCCLIDHE